MKTPGQRFVFLYLWKKNLKIEPIRADVKQILGPEAYSKAQIAR
jgi:hypothetical protein